MMSGIKPVVLAASLAVMALLAAGLSCSSSGSPNIKNPALATAYQIRHETWQAACLERIGCSQATEGLMVMVYEKFAGQYGYDPEDLWCADVTLSFNDGDTELHHFLVRETAPDQWEILEEVDVESCLEVQN